MTQAKNIFLVGVGMGDGGSITVAGKEAIESSDLLIGAKRLLEMYADLPSEKQALFITKEIVEAIQASDAHIVSVLLSGDTGFYSGATKLVTALRELPEPAPNVQVIPGISSMQYFFALIGKNWDDAVISSVHGREFDFVSAVRRNSKVFLLTGGDWKVHTVCARLVEAGLGACDVVVGERLAYPEQRIVRGTAAELANEEFLDLAVMVIEKPTVQVSDEAGEAASVAMPRILVSAPRSGSGKTSFVCGLMRVLQRRGLRVAARKCGPDYIDPMFHEKVIGASSSNIDLFFMTPDQARSSLASAAGESDIVVVEGAMGYYDGIAVSADASAWDTGCVTQTPAILVVDVHGQARSAAAEVLGFLSLRHPHNVVGVVLNRASKSLFMQLAPVILEETGVPVLGYVPKLPPEAHFESRHLGLVTAEEMDDLQTRVNTIADAIEQGVDIDAVVGIAQAAPALAVPAVSQAAFAQDAQTAEGPVIAVARDAAFCFYYADTLRLFEQLGARLVEFSPMDDERVPAEANGLYLGGGYPELYAQKLAENESMRASVRAAIEGGLPTIAECGGFLYLHDQLEGADGKFWPMAGVLARKAFRTDKLGRFGYVTLEAQTDGLLCATGETLQAHEFHYWESEEPGAAFVARKPQSKRSWECCMTTPSLYAGFPHVYLPSNVQAAQRFVQACRAFAATQGNKE